MKKAVSGIMLTLLLIGMLTLAFNIQPVARALVGIVDISVSDHPDPFNPLHEQNTITITNEGTIPCTKVTLSIEGIDRNWQWENVTPSTSVQAVWDGTDGAGSIVNPGTYNYTAIAYGSWQDTEAGTITVVLGDTWYVPDDYPTIQEAINAVSPGDTIYVRAGTYYENVVINKNNLTLVGENKNNTLIDGGRTGIAVHVSANNTKISGFTIQNSWLSEWFHALPGILLDHSSGNVIIGNIIRDNHHGVWLSYSLSNNITSNTIVHNFNSIWMVNSGGNSVTNNIITNSSGSVGYGILLWDSSHNSIASNTITNHWSGLQLWGASQNNITGNIIINNDQYGIVLQGSSSNSIYHNNLINNTYQVCDASWTYPEFPPSVNTWDNGYPAGGNYWSDQYHSDCADHYKGPGQDVPGSDGIVDTPYVIDENNQDNYPLMEPWTPVPINQPPSVPAVPQGPVLCRLYDHYGNYLGPWEYASFAIDPDGDDVKITFNWDDGTPNDESNFVSSGFAIQQSHSWVPYTGMHAIKAKATDIHGAESEWSSPLEVTVVATEIQDRWAGYLVNLANSPVATLSVEAQWTQPSFGDVPWVFSGFQGTWIGIGEVGESSRLLQAGVMVADIAGVRLVLPFYQAVQGGRMFAIDRGEGWEYQGQVSPGDLIETHIIMVGDNQWQISVKDVTKGWTWIPPAVTFDPDITTAEWIHEPGASGSSVASFTPIDFLKAQLTINGITYKIGSIDPSLNAILYQFNFARDSATLTTVSPISLYERFTISYIGIGSIPAQTEVSLSLHSSANLHVYDSLGNHVGYNATSGFIDMQIPDAMYFEDEQGVQYAFIFEPGEYRIELVGEEYGEFHLNVVVTLNGMVALDRWSNGTIVGGAVYVSTVIVTEEAVTVESDPVAELEHLREFIDGLPNDSFDKPELANQRKNALFTKIDDVMLKVEAGNYTDAVNKLFHDIRAKMDGDSTAKDWIADPGTQSNLCIIIDHIISNIETLQQT